MMDLTITVKLFATLRQDRFDVEPMEVEEGSSVGDIVDRLEIPRKDIALTFINGRHSEFSTELHSGDVVALFPPVGGG